MVYPRKFGAAPFFGGEPLLGFDGIVKPIITAVRELCGRQDIALQVSFTTNGYLLNHQRIDYFKQFPCSFQITLDGGRDSYDSTRFTSGGKGSFDVILQHIALLASARNTINLRVNYTSENLQTVPEILEELKNVPIADRNFIVVDFQRVWQDRKREGEKFVMSRIDCIRDRFEQEGFRCTNHALDDRVASSCYADKRNQLLINYNGDVYKCTARDFTGENRLGRLNCEGDIEWDSERISRWHSARFREPFCRSCKIAPLCGGGCTQSHIEAGLNQGCHLGYSKDDIENFILRRFEAKNMPHRFNDK